MLQNNSHVSKINNISGSPATSGRQTRGSYDTNFCRSTSSCRSWEASLGSTDISGPLASQSPCILNEANRLTSDYCNYSSSSKSNRNDGSPLVGTSTSEDINRIQTFSIEKHHNIYLPSPDHRNEQLSLQSNSSQHQIFNSSKSNRSTSNNTTVSGSFSLQEDHSSSGKGENQNVKSSDGLKTSGIGVFSGTP